MPEASRGKYNINERYAAMQYMGGGYKRESVVVIVDATEEELSLEGLDWALLNVVEPGRNELIVLGIFQEVQPYLQIWGIATSFTCCVSRGFRDKKLNQRISQKMSAFNQALQDCVLLQQRDGAKVHVRVTAGFTPLHSIALQETAALGASWVIIDRKLRTHKKYFSEQMTCNVVLMKSKSDAEVLRIQQEPEKTDVSLDSVILADISRGIQTQEKYMTSYEDAHSPKWQQQGPTALPPKRPSYYMEAPAKEFYAGSFSFRTNEPSIEVSHWGEPTRVPGHGHHTDDDDYTKASAGPGQHRDSDSDSDHSYTTPSPGDARAAANMRSLTQAVSTRFHQEPSVSAQPPSPESLALPDGYCSDVSSQSELESQHGGRTPLGLSTILQDGRNRQAGLKHLTVSTFRDERAVREEEADDPPSPSASVLAPTEMSALEHLDLAYTRRPPRPASQTTSPRSSTSSSYPDCPRTATFMPSSRSGKRHQQHTEASPIFSGGLPPPTRSLHMSPPSGVRFDSHSVSRTSAASSPTHSGARSARSSRSSSMRDSTLLSPPRFHTISK